MSALADDQAERQVAGLKPNIAMEDGRGWRAIVSGRQGALLALPRLSLCVIAISGLVACATQTWNAPIDPMTQSDRYAFRTRLARNP